jgi:adenosine kinase
MTKIAIVGPIPRDTIKTYKGEIIQKYGCVSHPTIALAKLFEDDEGTVVPICHVHKEDSDAIKLLFAPYSSVNTNGINSSQDKGTIIELEFIDQNNRIEKQSANMAPITPIDVAPFLDSDSFVFVPITDFEIQLETLQFIKENSNATIVFDAHGPTTYINEKGDRLRQYWSDREKWFPHIDILKMNLEESHCCWFDIDYDDEVYDDKNTSHLDDFAQFTLDNGVKVLYVTLDSRGAAMYTKSDGKIKKEFIKSVPVENVIDTTGCGDSFAGGLAYGLSKYKDPVIAGQYANVLGALRTQGKDFNVFRSKAETEVILKKYY